MFSNLISAGWLRVQQFSLAKLKQEVAKLKGIPQSAIEKIQCWPHQLWVVINGIGARWISYRCLPTWINQVIAAISSVGNFEQLRQLGNILHCEIENHAYEPEAVEELREAYRQKQNQLKEIQPQLEHQKKAQKWLEYWQGAVGFCYTRESLEPVIAAMNMQIQEFADLPEVIAKAQEIISNQLSIINSSTA